MKDWNLIINFRNLWMPQPLKYQIENCSKKKRIGYICFCLINYGAGLVLESEPNSDGKQNGLIL